jgi:glycosyltransferase involved in cell wall biosynthesis
MTSLQKISKVEMVSSPLVTIITPSLNQGRFVEATIQSVVAQDYAPIEHCVYDAGSTDETHDILRRYADRLRVTIAADRGQADALDRGFREARGEFVAWLNSDDVYLPGAVTTAVGHLMAHPDWAMVYGEANYIDAAGAVIGRYPTGPIGRLNEGCPVCQPAAFMRRRAVADVGGIDPRLQYCMDYDLWLRLAARYEIGSVRDVMACSRLHAGAKTVAQTLPFLREIVHMTHHRLGATPLKWLYGYANALVRDRLGLQGPRGPGRLLRIVAAAALTAALAVRHHRRVTVADLRLLAGALRPAPR